MPKKSKTDVLAQLDWVIDLYKQVVSLHVDINDHIHASAKAAVINAFTGVKAGCGLGEHREDLISRIQREQKNYQLVLECKRNISFTDTAISKHMPRDGHPAKNMKTMKSTPLMTSITGLDKGTLIYEFYLMIWSDCDSSKNSVDREAMKVSDIELKFLPELIKEYISPDTIDIPAALSPFQEKIAKLYFCCSSSAVRNSIKMVNADRLADRDLSNLVQNTNDAVGNTILSNALRNVRDCVYRGFKSQLEEVALHELNNGLIPGLEGYQFKLNTRCILMQPAVYTPDILGFHRESKSFVAIEVKESPKLGKEPSTVKWQNMNALNALGLGAIYCVTVTRMNVWFDQAGNSTTLPAKSPRYLAYKQLYPDHYDELTRMHNIQKDAVPDMYLTKELSYEKEDPVSEVTSVLRRPFSKDQESKYAAIVAGMRDIRRVFEYIGYFGIEALQKKHLACDAFQLACSERIVADSAFRKGSLSELGFNDGSTQLMLRLIKARFDLLAKLSKEDLHIVNLL